MVTWRAAVATPMRPSVAVARSAAWAAARGSGDPTTTPAETALETGSHVLWELGRGAIQVATSLPGSQLDES